MIFKKKQERVILEAIVDEEFVTIAECNDSPEEIERALQLTQRKSLIAHTTWGRRIVSTNKNDNTTTQPDEKSN
jgi:hypothetical protein